MSLSQVMLGLSDQVDIDTRSILYIGCVRFPILRINPVELVDEVVLVLFVEASVLISTFFDKL